MRSERSGALMPGGAWRARGRRLCASGGACTAAFGDAKSSGGGGGGRRGEDKKKSLEIGNFLLVDCAIGMVILKASDLYELR